MTTFNPDSSTPSGADIQAGDTPLELRCAGTWVLQGISQLEPRLARLPRTRPGDMTIDASALCAMDTSGA